MNHTYKKQTVLRLICVMIIFVSAVLGLYEYFVLVPRQAETFVISPLILTSLQHRTDISIIFLWVPLKCFVNP